jgi:hypothetical protein
MFPIEFADGLLAAAQAHFIHQKAEGERRSSRDSRERSCALRLFHWASRSTWVSPGSRVLSGSPWIWRFRWMSNAVGGTLDRRDVDALHLHHRVEGPPCPGTIGIADQPDQLAGNDLPRHAEVVFHPAALLSLGDRRECVGEAIGLRLGLHRDLEGDRFIELELRSAIRAGERLTVGVNSTSSTSPALPDG